MMGLVSPLPPASNLDPCHQLSELWTDEGRAGVAGVDVQPSTHLLHTACKLQLVPDSDLTDGANLVQPVEGTAARGAQGGGHKEWVEAWGRRWPQVFLPQVFLPPTIL